MNIVNLFLHILNHVKIKKGDIARTIFYFYTMYNNEADANFFEVQKQQLKIWHEQDPSNNA